ncbi:MAG: hypothetical protein HWN68_15510 [Desulfobacterales bacterium]|nr:hypothetical protein [Desulfobacterales bacterium]
MDRSRVLECIKKGINTVYAISEETELPLSRVHYILKDFVKVGFVERGPAGYRGRIPYFLTGDGRSALKLADYVAKKGFVGEEKLKSDYGELFEKAYRSRLLERGKAIKLDPITGNKPVESFVTSPSRFLASLEEAIRSFQLSCPNCGYKQGKLLPPLLPVWPCPRCLTPCFITYSQ